VASTVLTLQHASHPQCCWELMLSYISEYKEDKQLLTYPSEKLVETVGGSISLLESKMQRLLTWG